MFDRVRPCPSCPFRLGGEAIRFLGSDRASEIADSLFADASFTCHDDLEKPAVKRQHCVGATIMLEKIDKPNQIMRICERIGRYDRRKLVDQDEVFDNFDDWIEQQGEGL